MKDNGLLPNCVEYMRTQKEIENHWKEKHSEEIITANELDWLMNGCLMGMLLGVLMAALLISEVL